METELDGQINQIKVAADMGFNIQEKEIKELIP